MSDKVKSYQQGYTDACVHLGDDVPKAMLLDDDEYVSEDAPEFDPLSYLQGKMSALLEHVKVKDRANARSANVASCLANGIIPD